MNTRQIVAKNTILQISLQFFNLLAGLYSVSLIARYLGKTTFGKYGFISSFYFFFITFLDFGTSAVAIREVAKERNKAGLLLSNLTTFRLFLSILLIFFAITITNIYPFPKDLRLCLSLYAPILFFIALESIQIIFQTDLRYEYIALSSFFWRLFSLLFVILTVRLNLGLAFIVISFLLAEMIKYTILYISSKKFVKIKLPAIDIKLWKEIAKNALPIGITSLLITIIRNIDIMFLTRMKGFAEVGLYLAPQRLSDISLSLPSAFMGSIFPLMSKFYKEDFNTFKKLYQKTFDILSVYGILLTILVLILADKMIILVFGADFIKSALAFRILIFSALSIYLAIGSGTLLIVTDRQKANMYFYLLGAPLNIILNLILIPRLGFIGAAISNVTTIFLVISLTFYFVRAKVKIFLETKKIKRAILAALVTSVVLYYLKDLNLFFSIPIGMLLYSLLAIFLKAVDIDDIILLVKRRIQ